jgi:hypothetical protein
VPTLDLVGCKTFARSLEIRLELGPHLQKTKLCETDASVERSGEMNNQQPQWKAKNLSVGADGSGLERGVDRASESPFY